MILYASRMELGISFARRMGDVIRWCGDLSGEEKHEWNMFDESSKPTEGNDGHTSWTVAKATLTKEGQTNVAHLAP
jgi:hypothetical protein